MDQKEKNGTALRKPITGVKMRIGCLGTIFLF